MKPSAPPDAEETFDREKLLAAVHYVIDLCADDLDRLGKAKLHKALYLADMLAFVDTGKPITGVEYIKEPFGPAARYLGWALKQLENAGKIEVTRRRFYGLEKVDFKRREGARSNTLSEYERDLLAVIVEFVCGFSAKEISEISHDKPWQSVEIGERIPYASAFLLLPPRRPSARDIEWAKAS